MKSQFWLKDPSILFHSTQIWPNENMDKEEKLNSITRLVILLTCLLYLLTTNIRVIVAGVVTIFAIIILNYTETRESSKEKNEGFSNLYKDTTPLQKPTKTNPLMNVLLPQIQDDPNRPAASLAYKPNIVEEINTCAQDAAVNGFENTDDIKNKLFSDLGDNFMFDRSMIQFNANANTTIPNDQTSFAEFCYGDMISCKEGNAFACERNSPPHWING